MKKFDRTFPALLKKLHKCDSEFDDDGKIDFCLYDKFMSAEENAEWIKAWTANADLEGEEFRMFGKDGSGGLAAFWIVDAKKNILEQPIVFLGSEGEIGVVAKNYFDFLWLLAGGFGPQEAVSMLHFGLSKFDEKPSPNSKLTEFAINNASSARKTPNDVLVSAKDAFPDFEKIINSMSR